ncbi:endoglucanase 6-like [Benincasa hispida]|uniref:endoglucanase 6-like n=1 Tax=Benincasa hispida TaxID=102211 RepID=UPI0018FFA8E8|nr:endoglucanase 6-like [Benincasa hispida]
MANLIAMAPLFLLCFLLPCFSSAAYDYGSALTKSLLFFEAQRSGFLPRNQRVNWRSHSGLQDGKASGVDLVGGYYDAGDNVKFGLPMAFTVTMMSWSILEYRAQLAASGELGHAMDAVKWGTDYFIKAHTEPNVLYGEVGDGNTDHYCWQRPEDMTTDRRAYRIDPSNPGSDLAGETAAAMAAASLVFRHSNPAYANTLLNHAYQLFNFADKYRGKYDSSITVAQKYYRSVSGYNDELLWAAAWLYQASNNQYYLKYLADNGDSMGGTSWSMTEFSWDVKYVGVQTLVAKSFLCSCLRKGSRNVQVTPGGLIFRQRWNNMQFVTTASFVATVYADYLTSFHSSMKCPVGYVQPSELLTFAKSQVDYILGDNPRATSYMVGYGNNFPRRVHHRGSSIVSYKLNSKFIGCREGYATWFSKKTSDPNTLVGALVGGPDAYDNFADQRDNYEQTEPATYNNAPLLGILARFHGGHSGYDQLLPVALPPPPKTNPITQKPSPSSPSSSSPVVIVQRVTSSWKAKGRVYYRYSSVITNKSSKTVRNLRISISKLYGPLWGLTKSGNIYTFPKWVGSLAPLKSMEFVYIHSASQANVSVLGYNLGT